VGDTFTLLNRGHNRGTYRKSEITRDAVISIMSGGEDLKSLEAEIDRLLASIGWRISFRGRDLKEPHGCWRSRCPAIIISFCICRKGNSMTSGQGNDTSRGAIDWKHNGVRVIRGNELDPNTAQTPGMSRAAAIDFARVGAQKIWAGTVTINPNAKTGAHHHGTLESVIYVVKGRARMRWGERLEFVAEAGPGDFIFVPPFVPHQEINASPDESLECVVVRSDNEAVVVNLNIEPVEKPEDVQWVDPIHKPGR
jgi:uncharacterized RmlC-like cupin family protein